MPKTKTEKPISKALKTKKPSKKKKRSPKAKVYRFKYNNENFSLSILQHKFCELYLTLKLNASECIVEAGYNVKNDNGSYNMNLARMMGSENLSKPNIRAYIARSMDLVDLSKESLKREHAKLILQDYDLPSKARGIDMHYKKIGDYAPIKSTVTIKSKIKDLSDDELEVALDSGALPNEFNE